MTRVAVLGTGFIARLVSESLRQRYVSVQLIHAPRVQGSPDSTIDEVRAAHQDTVSDLAAQLAGADVVINAAGMPDASAGGTSALFGANGVLPGIVALAADRVGARRFLHVSSAVVQGRRRKLDESWHVETFSPYSLSKVLGERLAVAAAPSITTVYRPPSVHARDRRVTRGLTRIARSPLSSVAGHGERPTPQALAPNVGDALAHLALTPSRPPAVVAHPSEGLTTGSLLRLLGHREPRHVPEPLARLLLRGARLFEDVIPAGRAQVRRLEMVWFGQKQAASWLTADGWHAPADGLQWHQLGALGLKTPAARSEDDGSNLRIAYITTVPSVLGFFRGHMAHERALGARLDVVSSAGDGELAAFAVAVGASAFPVEIPRTIAPLADLLGLLQLLRVLRRTRPDIVQIATPKAGLLGAIAARLTCTPVVVVSVFGLPQMTETGWRRRMLDITTRISTWSADVVWCDSESMAAYIVSHRLAPHGRVHVIGHGSVGGVDATRTFNPDRAAADGRDVRNSLDIPAGAPVLGFVGRLARDKGMLELGHAWRSLRERHPEAHLLLVGRKEGDLPPEAERLLAPDAHTHVVGAQRAVAPYLAAMDLFVMPSYREGFCVANIEASAMRLPVVATRIPGCIDSVADGTTGTLIPPRNTDALVDAVEVYLASPELAAQSRCARA